MSRRARRALAVGAVVALVPVAACTQHHEGDGTPLVIGYVAARAGFGAIADVDGVDGAQFEVDRINRSGGIAGHPVELIVEDIGPDLSRSGDVAAALIARGAQVLLGPPFPDEGRGAIEVAAAAGIPMLSVTSTQPSFVDGHEGQTFLTTFGDNAQGAAAAQYAYGTGARTAVTITSPDVPSYTDLVPRYFADTFVQRGGLLVGTYDVHLAQPDFDAAAATIAALDPPPDVVYTTIFPPDLAALLHALRTAGYSGAVYSSDASDNAGVFAVDPADADGLVVTTHGFPQRPRSTLLFAPHTAASRVAEFVDAFTHSTGHAPAAVGLAALGADSIDIIRAAVEHAGGSTAPADIAAGIASLDGVTVTTGRVTYAGQHGIPRKAVYIIEARDGAFHLRSVVEPTDVPQPYDT